MLSDIENLDIMLSGNHLEREESENTNFGRRPESPRYDTLMNQNGNSHRNSLIPMKLKQGLIPKTDIIQKE